MADEGPIYPGLDSISSHFVVLANSNQPATQGICVMKRKLIGLLAASATFFGMAAAPVLADNLNGSFTTNAQFWLGNTAQNLRLTPGGLTVLPFTNPLTGGVSVTFTAECELIGSSNSWLYITILIDSVVVPPTGSDAAFCSGRGGGVPGGWSRNSITVAKVLTAGAHAVGVNAQVSGVHTGARIDDTTLLMTR